MKLTLTITASAVALARILETLDDGDATVTVAPVMPEVSAVVAPLHPAPVAPVMPEVAAVVPTIPGEPEFDSSGLAWDERIHSKQKGQTNDGKWRKQRGVDEDFYKAVEAELRARYSNNAGDTAVAAAIPVAVIPPMPMNPMGNDTVMQSYEPVVMDQAAIAVGLAANNPVPVAPVAIPMPVAAPVVAPVAIPMPVAAPVVAPVEAPAAPQPQANEPVTFHTIMMHVGTAMGAGVITPDYLVQLVNEINQQCGTTMQSFTDMAAFPNAVEYCWAAFARDGKL